MPRMCEGATLPRMCKDVGLLALRPRRGPTQARLSHSVTGHQQEPVPPQETGRVRCYSRDGAPRLKPRETLSKAGEKPALTAAMKLALRTLSLLLLLSGTLTQDEFNLGDALGDPDPTPAQPREQPKAPETDKTGGELDLFDALGPDVPPTKKPKKPSSGDSGGFDGFDLEDALKPDPKTDKPPVKPPKSGGGGGSFDDSDLFDVSGGDYKPDGGRSGGRASDPGHDPHGPADQPQAEAGSGQIAGIVSAIGVALMGAVSSYVAYQKKKLCFKLQGGADPESGKGHQGTHSEPQALSNLLQTN
ncbi:CD99 molecule [Leuresthes tenuis]|uniref:CD99 molecule n=1 Tax=Leuresthes tenuis TaxID=355514 RepID=UPI003B5086DF